MCSGEHRKGITRVLNSRFCFKGKQKAVTCPGLLERAGFVADRKPLKSDSLSISRFNPHSVPD